ncbi:hypothetical protein S40293_11507 [Stachybotrys chartarum IBT 40293]|nr:hypothetical protein S40293_11507 [Stachybotrys chartarum IBT 40293]
MNQKSQTSLLEWKSALSWRELILFNKAYLAVCQTPEAEDTTSTPYTSDFGRNFPMSQLLSLHEYGLFGVSSQGKQLPGSPKKLPDSEIWEERRQAQYLEFFIPNEGNNGNLIEMLLKDTRIQGVAFDAEGVKFIGSSENDIEVAWSRESTSPECLTDAEWACDAVIPTMYDCENYAGLTKIEGFHKARPIFCAISTLKDEINLLECVQEHIEGADLSANLYTEA